ncbi:MAG: DNA polymerase III subunit beta [Parabacteroides sp.]|nr:DNA polymerase III subunit beta [Parabacteroides sp.]
MTITISKTALLSRLQLLAKIIPAKSSTPILCHFMLETRDGRLFVTGSNSEGRITTSLECIFDEEISICVPTSILDGLKNLPEQPIDMIINKDTREIRIKYHGGKFEVMGYAPSTYPGKRSIEVLDSISLRTEDLFYGISKVINLAGNDDIRPVISSVFIETEPEAVCFVGTDAHGMGLVRKGNGGQAGKISVIISRPIASVLRAILPVSSDNLELRIGADWSDVIFNDYEISFRNVEGRFPNWRVVIPKGNKLELLVDTKQLIGAIKRTSVFSNKASCLIVLKIVRDKLTVFAQDIDFSTSAEETMEADFNGDDFSIGVKGSLLLEILSCIDDGRARLTFSEPSRAILITPESQSGNEELTYLLMPITIS